MAKHWMAKTKFYRVFCWIKARCNNPNTKYYHLYWGRGIKCEWRKFEDFYSDMFSSYKEWLTIERKNNDWNYCKNNCCWEDMKTQSWNRKGSIRYEWKCLSHWCDELNVNRWTIISRIRNWWDIKEAIFTPIWKTWISIRK